MTTIFVTASGTDVGKTFVCCRLIEELQGSRPLRVIKPVATGFDPDDIAATDTGRLLIAQGLPVDMGHARAVSPWTYRAALSPNLAAARESTELPYADLLEFSGRMAPEQLTLIEGIGGAMVPLDDKHTVLDWIQALNPTVWLVVGSYLGALSHSLTALNALNGRGASVGAIIVCESAQSSVELDDTMESLRRFIGKIPLLALARPPPPSAQMKLLLPLLDSAS